MAKEFCKIGQCKTNHTSFGGLIYPSDFNTGSRGRENTNGSYIAGRIMKDRSFDRDCQKKAENHIYRRETN